MHYSVIVLYLYTGVAKVKTTATARDVHKELSRYPAGTTAAHSSGSVLQPKNRSVFSVCFFCSFLMMGVRNTGKCLFHW